MLLTMANFRVRSILPIELSFLDEFWELIIEAYTTSRTHLVILRLALQESSHAFCLGPGDSMGCRQLDSIVHIGSIVVERGLGVGLNVREDSPLQNPESNHQGAKLALLLTLWPQANFFTSLCLSLLIYKIQIIVLSYRIVPHKINVSEVLST